MRNVEIETDYLVVGAGAVGMAFVDSILTETTSEIVMVDRRDKPGGHWNDAYPFVRLHQPSAFYGLNSRELSTGVVDESGLNKGYHSLASGQEVVSYFDLAMQQRFLVSGRVRFLPMSDASFDGTITSRLSGETVRVKARKIVDATYSKMEIPSTHTRSYAVAPGVNCVPPNDLPRVASPYSEYVVIGAGKTGMDACLWLLGHDVDPDRIRWIMPRDAWLLNRASYQPGMEFFAACAQSIADQIESIAEATSIEEVFLHREACGDARRIDTSVMPQVYHCAVVSDGELAELRRIKNIVRLGHVTKIDSGEIVLERGSIPTGASVLHIDCSAVGIPSVPGVKVFDGDRITLQWISTCWPSFSAALIGYIDSTFEDEDLKNRLCQPISPPTVPADWLRMMAIQLANQKEWSNYPQIREWQGRSRLDAFAGRIQHLTGSETDVLSQLGRYRQNLSKAAKNLPQLLAL